ncbi:SPX and EXS domain-containing protein 1-like, partial [Trifolium pratense]
ASLASVKCCELIILFLLGFDSRLGPKWLHSNIQVQQTKPVLIYVAWKEMGKHFARLPTLTLLMNVSCTVYRTVYIWVIGSNLVLRCTWTYKLSAHLRHNYLTVFTIAALEIFRRFQWIFFRVENEWNKMNNKSHMQMSEMSNEEEKLLHSMNYNV